MKHIMLDLETLDVGSNSLILSLALVRFDFKGNIGDELAINIDLQEQLDGGATVSGDTIKFWFTNVESNVVPFITHESVTTTFSVITALDMINQFCAGNMLGLWGNGATFDNVILRNLFKRHNVEFVLPFWVDRDVRTAVDLWQIQTKEQPFLGVHHNALDDCKHQIRYLTNKSIRV